MLEPKAAVARVSRSGLDARWAFEAAAVALQVPMAATFGVLSGQHPGPLRQGLRQVEVRYVAGPMDGRALQGFGQRH